MPKLTQTMQNFLGEDALRTLYKACSCIVPPQYFRGCYAYESSVALRIGPTTFMSHKKQQANRYQVYSAYCLLFLKAIHVHMHVG